MHQIFYQGKEVTYVEDASGFTLLSALYADYCLDDEELRELLDTAVRDGRKLVFSDYTEKVIDGLSKAVVRGSRIYLS